MKSSHIHLYLETEVLRMGVDFTLKPMNTGKKSDVKGIEGD